MTTVEDVTILVVEDQEGLAEAYTAVLSTEYTVRTALNGEQALEKADDDVDVVFLDRRMPGMSGDEVLTTLAERDLDAMVAMLTAVEPEADILEMPFDDYVTKPIENDDLLALAEELLEWSTYDTTARQYLRVSAKQAALENSDMDVSDTRDRLAERRGDLREQIDPDTLAELDAIV